MHVTRDDLDRFHDFAVNLVSEERAETTWLELFDLWRSRNPSSAEYAENVAAVREALVAMDAGSMRPLSEFDAEFRQRHGIADEA